LEVPALECISSAREGEATYLALGLLPGQQKLHGGTRAEVSLDFPHQEGDTLRYEWRFRLADNFKSDAPKNRWWIIGQWHDQPDKTRGEAWDGHPSRSPPVLVGLGEVDGRMAIGVEYGRKQEQKKGPLFIERGKWHHLAVVIKWSQNMEGRAEIFLDDMTRPALSFTGPNMHNGYQHYLKLGMYRHPAINTENWIHVDDVRVEKPAQR
jgi:hypothetical protein